MKSARILIILGVMIALSPFYGLPSSYMTPITLVFGILVVYIGYSLIKKDTDTKTETPPM